MVENKIKKQTKIVLSGGAVNNNAYSYVIKYPFERISRIDSK